MSRIPTLYRHRRPTLSLLLGGLLAAGCSGAPEALGPGSLQRGVFTLQDLLVPTGSMMIVNSYGAVTADANPGDRTLSVNAAALAAMNLAAGDLVMVYQAQGAQIATADDASYGSVMDLGGAGLYEVFRIDGTDATQSQIQIAAGCGLRNAYHAAGKTQVIRVPRYHDVTLQPSVQGLARGTLTAPPWNGAVGGVVALHAQTIHDDGSIDVSGVGFRGGQPNAGSNTVASSGSYRSATVTVGGEKGEGIAGSRTDYDGLGGRYGRGAPANGGGGGNNLNASGGGGANAGNVAAYTGDGVMASTTMYSAAWMLDPYYVTNHAFATSAGGGRGGYTASANAADPTTVAPGNAAWGGDNRQEHGGRGGHALAAASSRLFFGGGGGGGDADNGAGSAGGAGGGIALLLAGSITANAGGCVLAQGASASPAVGDGAGGGGGGGSVVLGIPSVRGVNITAAGGAGGPVSAGGTTALGPGGGGGGGYIAVPAGAAQAQLASGGSGGSANATAVAAFPPNGATGGGDGTVSVLATPLPLCLPANLAVTLTGTPTTVRINTPIHYTATVNNAGPEDATNVTLTLTVPPGTTVDTTPAGGQWSCVFANAQYTCTLKNLASGDSAPVLDFIYNAQMDAAETITTTATLAADNTDPDPQDNTASVTINIDRTTVNGGGFACSVGGGGAAAGGLGAWGVLAGAAAAALARARRRCRAR